MKRLFSVFILTALILCTVPFNISAETVSDFGVELTLPSEAEPGETVSVTATIKNISFSEGYGIYAASVFLYYDAEYLTPVAGSFDATVPKGWDKYDGTKTPGIWGLYTNFDGFLENAASKDGDISFTVSFTVSKEASPLDTYLTVMGCEGTEYSSSSFIPLNSFEATAYCREKLSITEAKILIPKDDTFTIDREAKIIYSHTDPLTIASFSEYFSHVGGTISVTAFDYEITDDSEEYIPNGATISVQHAFSGVTYSFLYYLKGDCDSNGIVNVTDLANVKAIIVNRIPVENHALYAIDLEADGVIRLADYIRLKRYFLEK